MDTVYLFISEDPAYDDGESPQIRVFASRIDAEDALYEAVQNALEYGDLQGLDNFDDYVPREFFVTTNGYGAKIVEMEVE